MNQSDVMKKLKSHRLELEAMGVEHLYVFGSVARNEAVSQSDVDLLAEFHPAMQVGFSFVSIKNHLEKVLGCSVDLLGTPVEKLRLKRTIEREAICAF